MDEIKSTISSNLVLLRKRTKITQAELAQKLNYSDKAISKWERGESTPDINVLKQIACIFDVSVDDLVSQNIANIKLKNKNMKKLQTKQKSIIAILSVVMVWFIAICVFVCSNIFNFSWANSWLCFVYAIPCSFAVLIVFSSIWKWTKFLFISITCFLWVAGLSIYLTFKITNLWLIFLIGIPIQIAIVLTYFFLKTKRKKL
ncbi:MAG: helix-turn-helix transcriptional regulator [Clostridia bacterium]